MAEKKLTIATLRKLVAKQTSIPESVVGEFLNQFFQTIENGLKDDGLVRLNGLGTLKVQSIQPRKSVNINTGEDIIIEGYNKVVFAADNKIKELANADNADVQPIDLDKDGETINTSIPVGIVGSGIGLSGIDPLQKLGEQAEEIKDILAELGASIEPIKPEEEPEVISEEEPEVVPEEEPEVVLEEEPEVVLEEEPEVVLEEEPEVVSEDEPEVVPEERQEKLVENPAVPETTDSSESNEKTFHPWLVAGITILIFCILLIGAYFFLKHKLVQFLEGYKSEEDTSVIFDDEKEGDADDGNDGDDNITVNITDELNQEAEDNDSNDNENEVDTEQQNNNETRTPTTITPANNNNSAVQSDWYGPQRTYTQFIKTEKLTDGSRLTHLSRKYYKKPNFWVYIYEANKDKIPNPNVIPIGTEIQIPDLPADLIDIHNERAVKQANDLQAKILGK